MPNTEEMTPKELLEARARDEITQEQLDEAIDKIDNLFHQIREADNQPQPVFNNNAHFFTKICSLKSTQNPKSPRKMYITGPGIDANPAPKGEHETDEAYYAKLTSVHGHLGSLLWLMTVGAQTFLETILPNLGEPEVVQLQSQFSGDYYVAVARYGNTSYYIQLSSSGDLHEANALLEYAEAFLKHIKTHEIDPFPVLENSVYFNETNLSTSEVAVPTVVPQPDTYYDKYANHVNTETAYHIEDLL